MTAPIAPGAHILVRDAVWRVVQVNRTSIGTPAWHVVGVSEIVRDQEAIFLKEYEPNVEVLDPAETELALDASPGHRDGLLYMESLLRDVPPMGPELHVGHQAAMDVLPYQLDPARQALQQPRQRILIADAVGLGKTLEAGVLLSELIRRGKGKRILVATTKSMLTQFQKEMWCRFSIPLVRLDSQGLHRIRAQIPTNHNPFHHFDRTIISIDTLKQNNAFRTHVERAWWDVIVIDEAHNVAARGGGRSQRNRIAEILASRSDALILLSATPHDGKARSFASLMNMLDPTAIANPDDYTRDEIDGLFVRRFKKDVAEQVKEAFPEREIAEAHATASPEEEAAFDGLTALRFKDLDRGGGAHMLVKTGLAKALFSSPIACSRQLVAPLRRDRVRALLPDDFFPRRRDEEIRAPSAVLSDAAALLKGDLRDDIEALSELAERLEAIGPQQFSKYQKLLQIIGDKKRGFGWSPRKTDDRLVIFSERIETLKWLEQQLTADLKLKPAQVVLMHGGLSDTDQQAIVEDFGNERAKV
ncbi:MAG TPA: helicase, partial [Deltaproteobacteria bacterium]|nr:helicase [Deltaproteobacteria bacterium]